MPQSFLPMSSAGRLPGGGDLWTESVDNQEEDTGSHNLVLRLTRVTETALTGKRELEQSCLWRTVAVASPAECLEIGKSGRRGGVGHLDLLCSQKPENGS